jgi:hypothetical protein
MHQFGAIISLKRAEFGVFRKAQCELVADLTP